MEKSKNSKIAFIVIFLLIVVVIATIVLSNMQELVGPKETLEILSGSENRVLEPLLEKFEKENNVDINMTYEGSVDIMQELQNRATGYDAVFPAK